MADSLEWKDTGLLQEVERRSDTRVSVCLQCHKCSAGCPTGREMDLLPGQVLRLIHLGAESELLSSRAIWLCATCETCTTRCPMEIDIAAVMDTLRILAVERKVAPREARPRHFNAAFLSSIRRGGRVYELGVLASYKIRSGDLFSDLGKAPGMLSRGKLNLLPRSRRGGKEVREVFRRSVEEEEGR